MLKYIYLTTKERDYLITCKENWFFGSFKKSWIYKRGYLKKIFKTISDKPKYGRGYVKAIFDEHAVAVPFLKEQYNLKRVKSNKKVLGCYIGKLGPKIYPKEFSEEIKKGIDHHFEVGGKMASENKSNKEITLSLPIEKVEEIIV